MQAVITFVIVLKNTMNPVRTILRTIERHPGITEAKFSMIVKKKGSKPDDTLFDATITLETASASDLDPIIGVMERSSGVKDVKVKRKRPLALTDHPTSASGLPHDANFVGEVGNKSILIRSNFPLPRGRPARRSITAA